MTVLGYKSLLYPFRYVLGCEITEPCDYRWSDPSLTRAIPERFRDESW